MTLKYFARLSILISLTFVIQFAGFPQPITGTLVNFMLIFTAQFLGIIAAIILGMLTPFIALLIGHLPPILFVMTPFIVIANWVIVVIFGISLKKVKILKIINEKYQFRKIIAVVIAAFCKFMFLVVSVKFLLPVILGYQINEKFVYMMMFPQLFTALAGGILAVLFFGLLLKIRYFSELLE